MHINLSADSVYVYKFSSYNSEIHYAYVNELLFKDDIFAEFIIPKDIRYLNANIDNRNSGHAFANYNINL